MTVSEIMPDRTEFDPNELDFPVIGVGASAGGLEAFEGFLQAINPNFPAAYILIQHLDPNHESILSSLLAKHTSLKVSQIDDGMEVEAGRVHIIPSGSALEIHDGVLRLVQFKAPRGLRRPIDDFFHSLALDQGPNAAGVVLSGTGGDGSVGIRAIKEAGGVAVAQDVRQSKYDGMPSSAIGTGIVDFVLPVEEMAKKLERYFEARDRDTAGHRAESRDSMARILETVRRHTGHDFANYKIKTVQRRVQRRMQVLDTDDATVYADALEESPSEVEALLADLLINVTSFFRDPEVFDRMRAEIIPNIVDKASVDHSIRVWIPGCSSGEEAYSIAILFAEALDRDSDKRKVGKAKEVQIFATDIDEDMLARARAGIYMPSVVANLPPDLLSRYFHATEQGYQVTQRVCDMVRVSSHSLIKDPPFSRLDLISCRNLLIYLDKPLQERVLPLFHYALRPAGWLLLGQSENVTAREELFDAVHRDERIYRKLPHSNADFVLPSGGRTPPRFDKRKRPAGDVEDEPDPVALRVMNRYAPPHVVIDRTGQVVHASPRTAPYLELAPGRPSMRLLDLAPAALRPALRSMSEAIAERRRRLIRRGIKLSLEDDVITVDVTFDPLDEGTTLVVFRERARAMHDEEDPDADVGDFRTEQHIEVLEDELAEARLSLRTTVEELETSNEELKSSNEEMMSMNEELQSANEELSTVNEELNTKLAELAQSNADLVNFLESTRIATVFLDTDLKVRSFTPETRKLFRFVDEDRGRSLMDVRSVVDPDLLEHTLREVLNEGRESKRQILIDGDGDGDEASAAYTFRALPYRDLNGRADGVVLVFEDVTQLTDAQSEARDYALALSKQQREIEYLYKNAPIGMALIGRDMRYRRINDALASYNGLSAEAHRGKIISEVLPEIGARLEPILLEVMKTSTPKTDFEFHAPAPTDPSVQESFELDLYPLPDEDETATEAVGIIVRRTTHARQLEAELRHVVGELQHRVKNTLATVQAIISQTVRNTGNREDLTSALQNRIGALAATHNLLTKADWRGVMLSDIVTQEAAPYTRRGQMSLDGRDMELSPRAALTLTMVVHELTTNAVKHGALRNDKGTVNVAWSAKNDRFRFAWQETMPDADVEEPDRVGFGLRFVQRAVGHDLEGTAEVTWREAGMECVIEGPRHAVALAAGQIGRPVLANGSGSKSAKGLVNSNADDGMGVSARPLGLDEAAVDG